MEKEHVIPLTSNASDTHQNFRMCLQTFSISEGLEKTKQFCHSVIQYSLYTSVFHTSNNLSESFFL